MGRRRANGMPLPEGVEMVRAKGRTYYYWNTGRGTAREQKRIPLPNADSDPIAFLKEHKRLSGPASIIYPPGSVGALVERYTDSLDFKTLSDSTRSSYNAALNR